MNSLMKKRGIRIVDVIAPFESACSEKIMPVIEQFLLLAQVPVEFEAFGGFADHNTLLRVTRTLTEAFLSDFNQSLL